jgi:hypothetical protein
VVEVELPSDFVGVIHVVGNASGEAFSVENLDQQGEKIGFLVNTTRPYDGIRPLDFLSMEDTAGFEVNAVGDWEIEVFDIFDAPFLDMPGSIEGQGDYVLILGGGLPESGLIQANEAGESFRILGYGNNIAPLVDTTEPVDGTFSISPDIVALEIQAVGGWNLFVEPQ